MYQISDNLKTAFRQGSRQLARISFSGVAEEQNLTESDIIQNQLSINRYTASGKQFEIGSAVAAELTMVLDNWSGKFNDTTFEGAELFVEFGANVPVADSGGKLTVGADYAPMGYFTVDEVQKKPTTITVIALDRMVLFDRVAKAEDFTFPITLSDMVARCCSICNVPQSSSPLFSTMPNASYSVNDFPENGDITYRQLIAWAAEITGSCAYIDWNGELRIQQPTESGVTIAEKDRFSSELAERPFTITGVCYGEGDEQIIAGEAGYMLDLTENELLSDDVSSVIGNISEVFSGTQYWPFSASVVPMPFLWPLDVITFSKGGTAHKCCITEVTYALGNNTSLTGTGESDQNKGYASADPLTHREKVVLKQLNSVRKSLNENLDLLHMNELMANAMGMFTTKVPQENGSEKIFLHDRATLAESQVIFTITSAGIAWTDSGWNNGNPVWQNSITGAGEAFFRIVRAMNIQAGSIKSADGGQTVNIDLDKGTFSAKMITNGVGAAFDEEGFSVKSDQSNEKSRLAPTGLSVFAGGEEKLRATKDGVRGVDFTAERYLRIGKNSRFEDYDGGTACFWIGEGS